jgi:hypothetical protein
MSPQVHQLLLLEGQSPAHASSITWGNAQRSKWRWDACPTVKMALGGALSTAAPRARVRTGYHRGRRGWLAQRDQLLEVRAVGPDAVPLGLQLVQPVVQVGDHAV